VARAHQQGRSIMTLAAGRPARPPWFFVWLCARLALSLKADHGADWKIAGWQPVCLSATVWVCLIDIDVSACE